MPLLVRCDQMLKKGAWHLFSCILIFLPGHFGSRLFMTFSNSFAQLSSLRETRKLQIQSSQVYFAPLVADFTMCPQIKLYRQCWLWSKLVWLVFLAKATAFWDKLASNNRDAATVNLRVRWECHPESLIAGRSLVGKRVKIASKL